MTSRNDKPNVLGDVPVVQAAQGKSLELALRRCSPETLAAARAFQDQGDLSAVPQVIRGIIERYLEPSVRPMLRQNRSDLRLVEDLGVDSLTMMEIILLAEEVLPVTVSTEELHGLKTLGEIEQFVQTLVAKAHPTVAAS